MARPMPRRAPVTTASLPVRSKAVHDAGSLGCLAVDEDFITRRRSPERRRPRRPRRAARPADQPVGRDDAVGDQLDRPLEVGAVVQPGADQGEFAPEEAVQVDLAGLRVDGHQAQPAAHAEDVDRGVHARGRAGHLEGDVGARAAGPLARPAAHVVGGRVPGGQPEPLGDGRAGTASGSATRTSAPRDRATSAMRRPTGPPPTTTTRSPARTSARPHVVHGDRGGLDQRRPVQGEQVGQADEGRGGHGPALLHRAGRVDADEVEARGRCAGGRRGRRGRSPSQRSGITVTASPGVPALDTRADANDPAGHLVPEDGGRVDPGVHVAVEDVQVGAADADERGGDLHLAGAGLDGRLPARARGHGVAGTPLPLAAQRSPRRSPRCSWGGALLTCTICSDIWNACIA